MLDFSQMCDDDVVDPVDDFFAGIADSVIDHVVIFNNIILIESLYLCWTNKDVVVDGIGCIWAGWV